MRQVTMENYYNPSLEAIKYDDFDRRFGIRKAEHLAAPRMALTDKFELPYDSIIHYVPGSDELGPRPTDMLLRKHSGQIYVQSMTSLSDDLGSPIKSGTDSKQLIDKYNRLYRTIRLAKDRQIKNIMNTKKSLLIINYSLLDKLYRYKMTYRTRVDKWNNVLATVIDKVNDISKSSSRMHYLTVKLPAQIPDRSAFTLGSRSITKNNIALFLDNESLMLLELWKMFGDEESLFDRLTPQALHKFNLVFHESGNFTVVNIGKWLSFVKSDRNPDGRFTKNEMRVKYLSLLNSIFTIRTVADKSVIEVVAIDDTEKVSKISNANDEVRILDELESKSDEELIDETRKIYISNDIPTDDPDVPSAPDSNYVSTGLISAADELLANDAISLAEYKKFSKLGDKVMGLPNPYGDDGTIGDIISNDPGLGTLKPKTYRKSFFSDNPSLSESILPDFNSDYINRMRKRDIITCVLSVANAGVAVTRYNIEVEKDIDNEFEVHSVQLTPIGGSPSTIRFRVPVVKPDGTYKIGGVNYRLRLQRGDIPIRKKSPSEVVLTSYYGKLFVKRSPKVKNDYGAWLTSKIQLKLLDGDHPVVRGNYFNHEVKVPRHFSIMSGKFKSFSYGGIDFTWDINTIAEQHDKKTIDTAAKNGEYICGIDSSDGSPVILSEAGTIYRQKDNGIVGSFESIFDIDTSRMPVEIAEIGISTKDVPVGILLANHYGLTNLIRKLGADTRTVVKGARMELKEDEFPIRFADQTLIVSRQNRYAMLALGGFNSFTKEISSYDMGAFDKKDTYGSILMLAGYGSRYQKEFDNLTKLFIDPITASYLKDMNEPEEFIPLILRCCELLTTDEHSREMKGTELRYKGYERHAGIIYQELTSAVRQFDSRPRSSGSKISMSPEAIWYAIDKDTAKALIEESNPIQNWKEKGNATFSGKYGRVSQTMTKKHRGFDPDDIGVVSEANVDNGDVGVTTFLTANPQIENLRGTTKAWDGDKSKIGTFLSPSALMMPFSTNDDGKRANFNGIIASHYVGSEEYVTSPVLTNFESVLPQQVDDLYAYAAKGPGIITGLDDDVMVVEYDDPNLGTDRIKIGRRYGVVTGKTFPHNVVCDLPVGHKFKENDVLSYNTGHFERDIYDPTQVLWKIGIMANVAIIEGSETYEDSGLPTERFAKQLDIDSAYVREITLRPSQIISNLLKVGDEVTADSILCNIQDTVAEYEDEDIAATAALLNKEARQSPKAKKYGTISRMEIRYNADKIDMSESMIKLVNKMDNQIRKETKALGDEISGGLVPDLEMDTIVLRIYITSRTSMMNGSKVTVGNQLKSVSQGIAVGDTVTENGTPIDLFFGGDSMDARTVLSAEKMGVVIPVLRIITDRAVKAFKDNI